MTPLTSPASTSSSPLPLPLNRHLQRDLANVIRLDGMYANQSSARLSHASDLATSEDDENIQIDSVISAIDRLVGSRLNSQCASLPPMVSQGVVPMGWRVGPSNAKAPAQLDVFDRSQRASPRRFAGPSSHPPPSLGPQQQTISPIALYSESMRESEAIASILVGSGIQGQTESERVVLDSSQQLIGRPRRSSISTVLSHTADSVHSETDHLMPGTAHAPSLPADTRSLPKMFTFRLKSPRMAQRHIEPPPKSPKSSIRRILFRKGGGGV